MIWVIKIGWPVFCRSAAKSRIYQVMILQLDSYIKDIGNFVLRIYKEDYNLDI
jgi:hypothetical protein